MRRSTGRGPKDKGYKGEVALAAALTELGIPAIRVPGSGIHRQLPVGDVVLGTLAEPEDVVEAKWQERIPKRLWEWLEQKAVRFLFIRRNRYPWLCVMHVKDFAEMYRMARRAGYRGPSNR